MPIIVYKEILEHGVSNEKISLAFNCEYENNGFLKLKNFEPSYFDCGSFRLKIEETIKKFNDNVQKKYEDKNNGVYYLAVLNYFVDEIPSIYSIKFESNTSESIYYKDELKSK